MSTVKITKDKKPKVKKTNVDKNNKSNAGFMKGKIKYTKDAFEPMELS